MRDMNAKGTTMNVTTNNATTTFASGGTMFPQVGTVTVYRNDHVSDHSPYTSPLHGDWTQMSDKFTSLEQALAGAKQLSAGPASAVAVWKLAGDAFIVTPLGTKRAEKAPFSPQHVKAGSNIAITNPHVAYVVDGGVVFAGPNQQPESYVAHVPRSAYSNYDPKPLSPAAAAWLEQHPYTKHTTDYIEAMYGNGGAS